jgi:hypothetical protein
MSIQYIRETIMTPAFETTYTVMGTSINYLPVIFPKYNYIAFYPEVTDETYTMFWAKA